MTNLSTDLARLRKIDDDLIDADEVTFLDALKERLPARGWTMAVERGRDLELEEIPPVILASLGTCGD